MNRTASDLPELRTSSLGAGSSVLSERDKAFDLFEMFAGGVVAVPGKSIEHWALQDWNREGESRVWVNLDATGVTIMDLASYRHFTMHHMAVDTLPIELTDTLADLKSLEKLLPGWNGYDVAAPKIEPIQKARKWILEMYEDVRRMRALWHQPHVTADADGDVMFEWWNNERGLAVYVSEDGATYIMDWGTNMETEMEDGEATTPEIRRQLWTWLTS